MIDPAHIAEELLAESDGIVDDGLVVVSWQVAGALLATPLVKGLKNDVGLEHVHDPHLLVVRHLTKAA